MGIIFDWIDSKFNIKKPHKRFFKRVIPQKLSFFHCLGGITFTFYLTSVISGILLSIHYIPSETEAYASIVHIQKDVLLGWLIRSVHKWSATLFIVFILLHTLRVFISRAYRAPRELNWIAGTLTLLIAFSSGFTGYLLPWDQKAYWATEVGTAMSGTIPVIGENILLAIRGGSDITGLTLIRFYSIHVLWLTIAMSISLWIHFHIIKRNGISGGM
ncbi:MAG: cytochrome b N-terminal domain-containing protein [Nitrospirae bacterium]|nr:cytochrome b N-terminal domain-containing protein [Nitrospirota bacterium]